MNSVNGAIVYYNGGNVEYSENRKRGGEEESQWKYTLISHSTNLHVIKDKKQYLIST